MAIAPRNFRASRDDPRLRNRAGTSGLLENQAATDTPNQSAQAMRQERGVDQQPVQRERDTPASRQQAQQQSQEQLSTNFEIDDAGEGVTVISEQDLQNSYSLQKRGVLPGDKIKNGELIRDVSSDPRGEVLTAYDIQNSPTLQNAGAEPGDMIEDRQLVKSGTNEPLRNFLYSFGQAETDVGNFGDYLESQIPLGRLTFSLDEGVKYYSPEEFYGEDVENISPDQIRNSISEFKEAETQKVLQSFEPANNLSGVAGTVTGTLASPTTALPAGAGFKGAAFLGSLYGFEYEAANQLAETGTVKNVPSLATSTALGTVGGPIGVGLARSLKYAAQSAAQPARKAKANSIQNNYEEAVNSKIALGDAPKKAEADAKAELGITNETLSTAANATGRKPKIMTTQDKARKSLLNDLSSDSAASRGKFRGVDTLLGAINTRLYNANRTIGGKLYRHEQDLHVQTGKYNTRVQPFYEGFNSLPRDLRPLVSRHLFNGEFDLARKIIRSNSPDALESFEESINVIKELGKDLQEAGTLGLELTENYWPRVVKDLEGLRNQLGAEKRGTLEQALRTFANNKQIKVSDLSVEQKTDIVNKVLRGYRPQIEGGKLSFAKPRVIEKITPEQLRYYHNPMESLDLYIRRSVNDIQKRKFFGKSAEFDEDGLINPAFSVGRLVQKELDEGTLNPDQQELVQDLLYSRFVSADTPDPRWSRVVKEIGQASTIANPISAVVNLEELGRSGFTYGMRNTLAALFGKNEMKVIDLGINRINQEFAEPDKAANYLTNAFRFSGFTRLDELGKNTTINAGLRKLRAQAKTTKGRQEIRRKYGEMFPDEMETVINDLAEGRVTDQTKALGFQSLENLQPISKSSLPEAYQNNPGLGRLLYMLKSFTLGNYNTVRNQIVREFNEGSKAEATKKAAAMLAYTSISGVGLNTATNMLLGRDVKPEDIPNEAMWHLMSIAGLNRYLASRYVARGDITDAVTEILTPPTPLIDDALDLGFKTPEIIAGEREFKPFESVSGVPIVGRLLYNWFGGGAERYNERLEEEE